MVNCLMFECKRGSSPLEIQYVGEHFLSAENLSTYLEYIIFNWQVQYQFKRKYTAALWMLNVTNRSTIRRKAWLH